MPNIDSIPVDLYTPLSPITSETDNIPLIGLITRIDVLNDQVDLDAQELTLSAGSQGSLSNRLDQSIEENGDLKTAAIDLAIHSIKQHSDTADYVRMTADERAKLEFISEEATALTILVETDNAGDLTFDNTTLTVEASDTIIWEFIAGKLSASIDFPTSVRHTHNYNVIPVTSNYLLYYTTSLHTAYKEGSLRVYVNGTRLNTISTTPVPFSSSGTVTWTNLKFSEGTATSGTVTGGDFSLSSTISVGAVVTIDFDVLYGI